MTKRHLVISVASLVVSLCAYTLPASAATRQSGGIACGESNATSYMGWKDRCAGSCDSYADYCPRGTGGCATGYAAELFGCAGCVYQYCADET